MQPNFQGNPNSRVLVYPRYVMKYYNSDDYSLYLFNKELQAYNFFSKLPPNEKDRFAKLIDYNIDKRYLKMSKCGTNLLEIDKLPNNFIQQLNEIADILKKYRIIHDSLPQNYCVDKDDKIRLIDFSDFELNPNPVDDKVNYAIGEIKRRLQEKFMKKQLNSIKIKLHTLTIIFIILIVIIVFIILITFYMN